MSELINIRNSKIGVRRQLLATVSAATLLAVVYGPGRAKAADQNEENPTVWIELGGSMQHIDGQGVPFAPDFLARNPNSPVLHPTSPLQAQRPPPLNFGEEGKISIAPGNSDWVFSAGVSYGRSGNSKEVDHQTNRVGHGVIAFAGPDAHFLTTYANFADTRVHDQDSHAVVDFRAGKDVGLGMFGKEGSSVLSLGVRFAQFSSKATLDIRVRPDLHVNYQIVGTSASPKYLRFPLPSFHTYHVAGVATRSFHGVGPTLSWDGSVPLAGNPHDGEAELNWGANAALLFGRQKTTVQHTATASYCPPAANHTLVPVYRHTGGRHSIRSVAVPNVGGLIGATYRIENFKVSTGYRADFFFGAIDGGVDTRKPETLGFYGPFASVSVGLP